MDRYRLKNIIILILVLVNAFLLASLIVRKTSEYNARKLAVTQLVELFAADEIALSPDAISTDTPPSSRVLTRDTALDREVAAFFLGSDLSSSDQGGDIYTYSSSRGAAIFRENGSFDAAGTLSTEDPAGFCREFGRKFSYSEPTFRQEDDGSETATMVRNYNRLPVFNCTVTFTFRSGTLVNVSGTLLPENYTELTGEEAPLSASAALTAFLEARRQSFAAVSAITDLYLCYELQSTTASSMMTLVPAWCIVTDTAKYYVNCSTGAVVSA